MPALGDTDKSYRFRDEWITSLVMTMPEVPPGIVDGFRAERMPYLSQALVDKGTLKREVLVEAISNFHAIRSVNPSKETIDKMTLSFIPEKICRRHFLLPLEIHDQSVDVAMINPLDLNAHADVQALTGRVPTSYFCFPSHMEALLTKCYQTELVVNDLLSHIGEHDKIELLEGANAETEGREASAPADPVTAPIIALVNAIISKAVSMGASDIHIEHAARLSTVRYRIHGDLRPMLSLPREIAAGAVVSRIKIMADLDIADRMRPQDGRASIMVGATEYGLRISSLPTNTGEKIVIRILDPGAAATPFEELGFQPEVCDSIQRILRRSQGLMLVTGPTGSGKTTTLYSALNRIKAPEINITTIEDPVEYKLDGINQVRVLDKQGLTFAAILRSVMRQDPDVIMIGEVRDRETAEMAIQAALTGHFVLTTIHTNDTVSSLTRLADMGIERFKLAPALLAVTAQRMVRSLCPACKAPIAPALANPRVLDILARHKLPLNYYKSIGCEKCEGRGYSGRILISEYLEISNELREAISMGMDTIALRRIALESGALRPLVADAMRRLSSGETSIEELLPHIDLETDRYARAAKTAAIKTAAAAAPGQRKILVIDDDPAARTVLRKLLEASGFLVDEAADGTQALSMISQAAPDLLLLDLKMPVMDGFEVLRKLNETSRAMPVIVLTASSDDNDQEKAFSLGADDYIMKPSAHPLILARINAVFHRNRVGVGPD